MSAAADVADVGADFEVHLLDDELIMLEAAKMPGWLAIGARSRDRAKQLCPVGHDPMTGRAGGGDHLKDTIVYEPDADKLLVGSRMTVDDTLALLGLIELGTEAHPITGNPVLAFTWHGQQAFFAHVNHPGTKKNPFVMRAIQQVVWSMGTAEYAL